MTNTVELDSRPRVTETGLRAGVDQCTRPEWNGMLASFPDASMYQSWDYGQIHWGRRQLSHLVLRQGDEVVAMAQVRIVRVPVLRTGIAYVRWGPLVRGRGGEWNPAIFGAALRALQLEYAIRRGLLLRIIPNVYDADSFAESTVTKLRQLNFARCSEPPPYHTTRLDLSRSEEDLRRGLRPRWRNKLKHAEAAGFRVTVDTSDRSYTEFLRAHEQMMARKRYPTTVSVEEFGRIQSSLPESLKMQVLLCEKDGCVLNALVIAPGGDTGIYVLAATSHAGLSANGACLLQWRAIRMLKEGNFRWYDLGGINPEANPGVYQFKSGIGGTETCQLGRFEYRANWASSLCVGAAERLVALARRRQ